MIQCAVLHHFPQPVHELFPVVLVLPGAVERGVLDHQPGSLVPDEGHGILLNDVQQVHDVAEATVDADVVNEALQRGYPNVEELAWKFKEFAAKQCYYLKISFPYRSWRSP